MDVKKIFGRNFVGRNKIWDIFFLHESNLSHYFSHESYFGHFFLHESYNRFAYLNSVTGLNQKLDNNNIL